MNSFAGKVIGVLLSFVLLVFAPMSITIVTQNIRTERLIWNSLTYYCDVVADKGLLTKLDYEEFVAKLGATMIDFDVVITLQRKEVLSAGAGSFTIKHVTVGVWKSSAAGVTGTEYLYAGDNIQVVLNPLSNTQADGILSRILGLHTSRQPISYASNVRNDGY